jgi:hypothetical protein
MVTAMANALMSAQVDQVCGAEYGERSPERSNRRNGYRAENGTPAPGPSSSPCPNCAKDPTSRSPTDDRNPYALAAGIAISLVDGYRRALAELGAPR